VYLSFYIIREVLLFSFKFTCQYTCQFLFPEKPSVKLLVLAYIGRISVNKTRNEDRYRASEVFPLINIMMEEAYAYYI
jgi:hypothetical protein